jgi:ribonuclease T2
MRCLDLSIARKSSRLFPRDTLGDVNLTKRPHLALFCVIVCVSCAPPQPSAGPVPQSAQTPAAGTYAPRSQTTSPFDYYLLNLSWAPEFCHNKPDNPECSGHFGFIVHGLWPQYSRGGYPENCGQQPGLSNPSIMLDIMPDLHLIQHEWSTHGTCTGLTADDYFALIRRVFQSVKIPPGFLAPARQFSISPEELKQDFEQANPGIADSGIAVSCGGGPYLVAVEICYAKNGRPTQCGGDIRDCNKPAIRVPRVQ